MRILFVSSLFPNSLEPNRGVYSLQIVREMARHAEVRVVAPVASLGSLGFLEAFRRYRTPAVPETETLEGLSVWHPRYFAVPKMGFLHARTTESVVEPVIRRLHAEWGIDAVNCHWIFPDGVAVQRVCAALKIPVMLTPLGCDLNRYLRLPLRHQAIKSALLGADRISVLNREMWETCREVGVSPARLAIIPNGVDTGKFSPLDRRACRRELGLAEEGRMVLFVGSLDPVKGIDTLLEAFASLPAADPASLFVVGSGHLEQELKALAARLGGKISFVGAVPHDRLPLWMNAADCLCLPSLREGHPNVMMEALSCGTPVVASAVGSIPEFVDESTGYTITPGDHRDLGEKLSVCLTRPWDREGIRRRVATHSWSHCAMRYLEEIGTMTNREEFAGLAEGAPCAG